MAKKWIKGATEDMKKKGTEGKFGKATDKKIEAGKKAGGVKKKEAVFAENMKKVSKDRSAKPAKKSTIKKPVRGEKSHNAVNRG